jgi:hypothetical protein
MLGVLRPYCGTVRLLTPESERALPQEVIRRELELSCAGIRIECYGADYQRWAQEVLSQGELGTAYVTGSMYMVGKVRQILSIPKRPIWTKATNGVL